MRRDFALMGWVILGTFLGPVGAQGAWPHDPFVNLKIPTPSAGQSPSAASDGQGGAFVVWEDSRTPANGLDLYAQHIRADGTLDPAWPALGLSICAAAGNQQHVRTTPDGAGGFYAVWEDLRSGGADLYATRVGAGGALVAGWASQGTVVTAIGGEDLSPSIAVASDGSLYVSWEHVFSITDHDPYAQHLSASGAVVVGWPGAGLSLTAVTSFQGNVCTAAEPGGGVYVAYQSNESGTYDIHVKKLTSSGSVTQSYDASAVPGDQVGPVMAPDGFGGVIIAYQNLRYDPTGDVVAIRFLASGANASGWYLPDGVPLLANYQVEAPISVVPDGGGGATILTTLRAGPSGPYGFQIGRIQYNGVKPYTPFTLVTTLNGQPSGFAVPDGQGGVVVVGSIDDGYWDVLAARITASGSQPEGWSSAPTLWMSQSIGFQLNPTIVSDGAGGAIAFWTDTRNTTNEIFAQRIERFGRLGSPEPDVVSVRDVLNDQGGQVRVSWTPSYLDVAGGSEIQSYRIWRQVPASQATALLASGNAVIQSPEAMSDPSSTGGDVRRLMLTETAAGSFYWEWIGSVPAIGLSGYSLTAQTEGDSLGGSNPYTLFAAEAWSGGAQTWMSFPDSGYSVDNLAPPAPQSFSGTYVSGTEAFLSWGASQAEDLAGYRLYRGIPSSFQPGPGNEVWEGSATSYVDAGAPTGYYKVCPYDVHGNQGPCTLTLPSGTVGVEASELPRQVALHPIAPNPVAGACRVRFALPRAAHARITIHDVQGRLVRTLIAGDQPPGELVASWDGLLENGARAGGGLFFVRLTVEGRSQTRHFVRLP